MFTNHIIVEAKSYESALNEGLEKLNLTEDDIIVEILEEEKGRIFKKSHIKLKLIPKLKNKENVIPEEVKKINNDIEVEKIVSEKKSFFQIGYLPDGVYITITDDIEVDDDYKLKNIIKYLDKKSIQEYDANLIKNKLQEGRSTPFKIAPYQQEKLIDGDVDIQVSQDRLKAYIVINEADGGENLTSEDILIKLKENGIIYGINKDKISNLIKNKLFNKKVAIAMGKPPIDGEDSQTIYHFSQVKSQKPKILKDGTVDFKELNLIKNVKKGQLLIEIIPPNPGETGRDVYGQEIPNKEGRVLNIIKGKNVVEKEEELKIYATIDGQVLFKDGKIEVNHVYEIPGDVDTSTGNIKFNGDVIIKGNVKSGFTVEADGNIQVNGVVEGAVLIAKENIVLNRGVQGNNQSFIKSGGNLKAKYIENSEVNCKGDLEADVILHSNVTSGSNVIAIGKRGLIAGGNIKSGEEIRAKTIGSHMGTTTNLEVGINPEEKQEYEKIDEELKTIQKNLNNLDKTINLLNRLKNEKGLSEDKEEILIKSKKTKDFLEEKNRNLVKEREQFEKRLQNLSKGKIHISGTMYTGVKIIILNAVRHIYDEITYSTLYREDGEIVIGPYEK